MGYELGEKADEVEEDDDGAVEVGRVSSPPLPGLQRSLASLHLTNCPLEHLNITGVLSSCDQSLKRGITKKRGFCALALALFIQISKICFVQAV